MIVLVIAGILLVIGVPQYRVLIQTQNTTGEATNLYNDIMYARSEAMKEGQFVSICVANSTLTGCGTGTWASGWIIYSNPGATSTTTFTSGTDVILRTQHAFTSTDVVATSSTTATTLVTYNRDGFGMNLGTSGLLFTVTSATSNTETTRCLWLSPLGTPAVQYHGQTAATGQGTNTCT